MAANWPLPEPAADTATLEPASPRQLHHRPSTIADGHSLFSERTAYSIGGGPSLPDLPQDLADAAARKESDLESSTTGGWRETETDRRNRVSRSQSLSRQKKQEDTFWHAQAHEKTSPLVIVDFDGPQDPYHPRNWPIRKKIITTMLYAFTAMGATFASSVYSQGTSDIGAEFGVSQEVALLGVSLLLAGFGLGPLIWAPLSEMYGRRLTVLLPYFMSGVFTFWVATAKDLQTVLICRFFTGLFGAAPVTNVGGVLADLWDPTQRGIATVAYALAVTVGPVVGPIVGGAIEVSDLGWRWSQYVTGAYIFFTFALDMLIIDESYAPAMLCHKASRLRIISENWSLHAKHEEWDPSFKEMSRKFGARPFQMLLTPICFAMAVYASFVYGILYSNLASFPIEFQRLRAWNPLVGALPFLAFLGGIIVGAAVMVANQFSYNKRFRANNGKTVPEARLFPMMIGSVFFAAGLFVFGWGSSPEVPSTVPIVGCALVGFGFFTIFQSSLGYLIDTFQTYAASAIAAHTFLRSSFALAFPLIIDPVNSRIGLEWTTSIFAICGVLLIPTPFLFYKFGPQMRKKGRYTTNMA